jgi:HSP20 family molecular chaperone IbpA
MLARADRLHREFFRPSAPVQLRTTWEPPIDVLETKTEVLIFVALPGVAPDRVVAAVEGSELVIAGERLLPTQLQTAVIHRLELPQGHFSRRVRLPAGRYTSVNRTAADGCLLITLQKAGGGRD